MMEWIDAHLHIGEDRSGVTNSLAETRELFEEGHIDRAVVFCLDEADGIPAGNQRIREIIEGDDRLQGLFRLDPDIHQPDDLKGQDDFAGFKLHPRSQDFRLDEIPEYLDAIEETGKPVLIHTGIWREFTHPRIVANAMAERDGSPVVLAHSLIGYYFHAPEPWREKMQGLDHIHIDLSLYSTALKNEVLLEELGADRLLFASDFPYDHPATRKKVVEMTDASDEEIEKMAGGNAERLFF